MIYNFIADRRYDDLLFYVKLFVIEMDKKQKNGLDIKKWI